MAHPVFELFQSLGFIKNGKPNISVIENSPVSKIVRACEDVCEMTKYSNVQIENGIYRHAASIGLGGGKSPCRGLSCRTKNINELVLFSALYSDNVYIQNYFQDIINTANKHDGLLYDSRKDFLDDIIILCAIGPLLNEGLIDFVSYDDDICWHCFGKDILQGEISGELDRVEETIITTCYKEMEFDLTYIHEYKVNVKGPSHIIYPHGSTNLGNFQ